MASPIEMLKHYSDSGYPAVCVETYEETRLIRAILQMFPNQPVSSVDASQTLTDHRTGKQKRPVSFPDAFKATSETDDAILIAFDFRHIVNNAGAYRPLLTALPSAKRKHALIVLISPTWTLPEELRHEVPILQIPLPTPAELGHPLSLIEESVNKARQDAGKEQISIPAPARDALTSAARGLTLSEAENAFALSLVMNGDFQPKPVEREKMRLVRSECMTVESPADPALLGGLDRLKEYIQQEVIPAQLLPDLQVRGLMFIGVPGTGKSLAAKVLAALLGWPIARLDAAAAKGSLLGQSEANIRAALRTADAIAPCVLWLDEIEKAVGGYASSSQTDGGTTLAMVGTLLTWMQEHTSPVMVVATCNDYAKLPPELTRAGRFDERFFLDLPTDAERIQIAAIHLARLKCTTSVAPTIAKMTPDWTGAEIEQLIKSTARRTARKLTEETLTTCAAEIKPISKSANIQDLRKWAEENLRRANAGEASPLAPDVNAPGIRALTLKTGDAHYGEN